MAQRQSGNREQRIDVRVTDEEARIFREHARAEGLTVSAWLRRLAIYEARNALRKLKR